MNSRFLKAAVPYPKGTRLLPEGGDERSRTQRIASIEWVRATLFPRIVGEMLSYKEMEEQLTLYVLSDGTEISLQYPGGESLSNGDIAKIRPYDFRPKLAIDGQHYPRDLRFDKVWGTLYDVLDPIKHDKPEMIEDLAAVFYRLAYMVDHQPMTPDGHCRRMGFKRSGDLTKPITKKTRGDYLVKGETHPDCPPFPGFRLDEQFKDRFERAVGKKVWAGMSLETFLLYNDIIAWNEDCKYHYRETEVAKTNWNPFIGRNSTWLTHLNFLGLLLNRVKAADLLGKLMYGGGVAPATQASIRLVCNIP